jgi:serine/threonine-protein kinase
METPPPRDRPAAIGGVVERRTLAEFLRTERASGAAAGWPLERVVRTLEPIARTLASAAHRGVVHGAVRADHISLVEVDGEIIAELAGLDRHLHGAPAASPIDGPQASSAAPEQLLPALGPTGPWTDVYALALLCVELMLGRPVTEGSAVAALARTRDDAVQPTPHAVGLEVPAAVEAVMAMAMAMRPMQRYQDVGRFWAALRDSLAASQPATPPPSRPPSAPATSPRPAKLARRAWALDAALIVITAAVVTLQRCG